MSKDLEWLKREINNMKLKGQSIRPKKINNKLDMVLDLINQLPKVEPNSKEHSDLLEDFRCGKITPNKVREIIGLVDAESEETEVKKDIEKAIDNLDEYLRETATLRQSGAFALINMVRRELEKLETLSQEWVEDNFFEVENWADEVFISDGEPDLEGTPQIKVIALQDLKKVVNITSEPLGNSEELPVVPKFVADFIKENKGRLNVFGAFIDIRNNEDSRMWEWVFNNYNQDEFAEAWLAYPNIEVEQTHPILQAFDEKAEEFKEYSDSYRRIQEIRGAIENVIEEEKK